MPWNVTIDFSDVRPRVETRVSGTPSMALAIEKALMEAGIRHIAPVLGDPSYQVTVTPCE